MIGAEEEFGEEVEIIEGNEEILPSLEKLNNDLLDEGNDWHSIKENNSYLFDDLFDYWTPERHEEEFRVQHYILEPEINEHGRKELYTVHIVSRTSQVINGLQEGPIRKDNHVTVLNHILEAGGDNYDAQTVTYVDERSFSFLSLHACEERYWHENPENLHAIQHFIDNKGVIVEHVRMGLKLGDKNVYNTANAAGGFTDPSNMERVSNLPSIYLSVIVPQFSLAHSTVSAIINEAQSEGLTEKEFGARDALRESYDYYGQEEQLEEIHGDDDYDFITAPFQLHVTGMPEEDSILLKGGDCYTSSARIRANYFQISINNVYTEEGEYDDGKGDFNVDARIEVDLNMYPHAILGW